VKTGVKTYVKTGGKVVRAAVDTQERANLVKEVAELVDTVTDTVGLVARTVSEVVPIPFVGTDEERTLPADALGDGDPASPSSAPRASAHPSSPSAPGVRRERRPAPPVDSPEMLRRRGAELLDRSRDVWAEEQGHPAYARILSDLAPDEARILLLLVEGGPQPSVDVRTGGPTGLMSSQLIAPGLSMIGPRAGLRYPERVPAYLNNLFRLGLVWFAKEPLRDNMEYQVLEAQPDVLGAFHSVKFAKIVRRSIHLTPFGDGFARMCLLESPTRELPEHGDPHSGEAASPPAPPAPDPELPPGPTGPPPGR